MTYPKNLMFAVLSLMAFSGSANADTRIEQKLMQFGGPETRVRCVSEWKTKGIPDCRIHGFEVRCEDTWISGCSGWATDFYQHEFFLVATGPDVEQAVSQYAKTALEHALAAAVIAGVATPGEVGVKAAAAYTAFKVTLVAELAGEPLLDSMKDRFEMHLEERGSW